MHVLHTGANYTHEKCMRLKASVEGNHKNDILLS